jgi:hypothetical protein
MFVKFRNGWFPVNVLNDPSPDKGPGWIRVSCNQILHDVPRELCRQETIPDISENERIQIFSRLMSY